MTELFRHPLSQAALWFAVILALLAFAFTALRRWRGSASDAQQDRDGDGYTNLEEFLNRIR